MGGLHSFSLFVFTRHGAEKGADRFYAWPDALSHLKIKFYVGLLICIYLILVHQFHALLSLNV
ncbi:hypothetical protein COL60_12580 [Bacillus pseudomycoides]|nr:hypothetical protein COL60_12580 [Bacillus pseudomycoides]PGC45565.1 hypothetical protein COM14_21080 [Bacillus pseudomycoides]